MNEVYRKQFRIFNVIFQFSVSNEGLWYSINKKNDHKEVRYLSIEKTIDMEKGYEAYKLIFFPLLLTFGFLKVK